MSKYIYNLLRGSKPVKQRQPHPFFPTRYVFFINLSGEPLKMVTTNKAETIHIPPLNVQLPPIVPSLHPIRFDLPLETPLYMFRKEFKSSYVADTKEAIAYSVEMAFREALNPLREQPPELPTLKVIGIPCDRAFIFVPFDILKLLVALANPTCYNITLMLKNIFPQLTSTLVFYFAASAPSTEGFVCYDPGWDKVTL